MFQEVSRKQFWCSQKRAGRLVGQSSRWHQGDSASWTAALLTGQGGHSLHPQITNLQSPLIFLMPLHQIEFLLDAEFRSWEIMQQKALHILQIQQFRERPGWKESFFFLLKQNKVSAISQEFQMAILHFFLVIWIKLKGQRLDSHEQEHFIFAGNFSS